ncbi:MAG TPA: glycosyltransferase [Ginsengibacter sp.]
MKVLFFIDSLGPGGKERRLAELMKILNCRQVEFELVVMNKEIHYKEILNLDIKIHYLIRNRKKDAFFFRRFYTICKEIKPDFIHCWDGMTAIYAIPAATLLNIKLINGMITDALPAGNIFNKSMIRAKLTFPFSNVIIGNSKAGLVAYQAPRSKSFCIHNGFNFDRVKTIVNDKLIRERVNIKTRFIVGMVASFSELKDYSTYFKAAQLLLQRRNDITFLAIGSKTDSADAQNHIAKEYENNFRLLGIVSDAESYINAMDVCILSTFTEGISNSVLEYMALGKPVIATDGGGTSELVKHEQTGFLVQQASKEDLAHKIEVLLDNDSLRAKFGNAGKERIKKYFSIDRMANRYISAYKKMLTT